MVLRILSLCGIYFLTMACSVEKVNLSPAFHLSSNTNNISDKTFYSSENRAEFIRYSSDITHFFTLMNGYVFTNKEINQEISNLKFIVSEYIYAVREHNSVGRNKALYNYEKSYKKLQKFRKKASLDEQEMLNRFLVNIKTNITLIESLN